MYLAKATIPANGSKHIKPLNGDNCAVLTKNHQSYNIIAINKNQKSEKLFNKILNTLNFEVMKNWKSLQLNRNTKQ